MMFLVLFSDWNRDLMHMLEQFHLRHFTAAARAGANDSNSNPTPTDILKIWNKNIYKYYETASICQWFLQCIFQEGCSAPSPGLGSRPLRFGTDCSGAEVRRFRRWFCPVWSTCLDMSRHHGLPSRPYPVSLSEPQWLCYGILWLGRGKIKWVKWVGSDPDLKFQ